MATNYKNPPKFEDGMTYERWKNELAVWELVTDLEAKKRALAMTLTLTGRAREAALEVPAADLNKDDGIATLLKTLDKVFEKEKIDNSYEAYKMFDKYARTNEAISEYIVEFERRYNRCKKFEMPLPDAILAFKLLDGAGLDLRERQMAMTACSAVGVVTFNNMKSALNRIFADKSTSEVTSAISVKSEPEVAMFTNNNRQRAMFGAKNGANFARKSDNVSRGTNPLNKFGKRTKCAICQSVFHWVKDCPHKDDREGANIVDTRSCQNEKSTEVGKGSETFENCNLTLFTKESQEELNENQVLVAESLGTAVLDTACTKTVCGQVWFDHYRELLSDVEKQALNIQNSRVGFRFGDGVRQFSTKKAKLPAVIAGVECQIETEVVEADIPLLLSKASLKKAGAILNLQHDSAILFGKEIQLEFTSGGHYCVSLRPCGMSAYTIQNDTDPVVLAVIQDLDEDERKKAIIKLHSQFGHASAERLWSLLKKAGDVKPEIHKDLTAIVDKCAVCLKYKKPAPRPAVGFPLASRFNETVAVDLHQLEKGKWYLHIIDEFTRYSAGGIITSKAPKVFVEKFIQLWISVHGPPKTLFSDNGGEFSNNEVRDMAENFNIEVKNTPAESPWSNGLMERHNQTLTDIMTKVKEEQKCDYETALAWALMAKNTLHNAHGYSAHQLIHGENPNLPSVLIDKPPALEGTTASENIAKHINAMHAARKAFAEAECSERIRRALRKNLRPVLDNYQNGDKVYYKRMDSKEWKGPGIVLGQDGMVVLVKHGGTYVRVHRNRLRKEKMTCSLGKVITSDDDMENDNMTSSENTDFEGEGESDDDDKIQSPLVPTCDNIQVPPEVQVSSQDVLEHIKIGKIIKFQRDETLTAAKVLSRAGKATGKNRNWFNVELLNPEAEKGSKISVDLSQVGELEVMSQADESQEETVHIIQECVYDHAKADELANWKRNGVYTETVDEGQRAISTRWVCTVKQTEKGPTTKARLVARGFEEYDKDKFEKDSPTCSQEALKVVLAVMAQQEWQPHSMDIKAAFLQGSPLSRKIYIKPPKEANATGKLWLLHKCVYGLTDASLHWYTKVKNVLIELGAKNSKMDPAVFFWSEDGSLHGILACHVDDFLWAGDTTFQKNIMPKIREIFEVGREETSSFSYTGLEIRYCGDHIELNQEKYGRSLEMIDISKSRSMQKEMLLEEDEKAQLRSKIGQILWMGRQSRPDIMFDACMLASAYNKATVKDILDINKVIGRLKQGKLTMKFQKLCEPLQLTVFADASFGNLPDGGTQGGYIILLTDATGKFSPVCWVSKKIRRIVRSTLAGEVLAMSDAIDSGIFLANMFSELLQGEARPSEFPLVCVTDNKSLFDAVKSNKSVSEKRLRLEVAGIKELMDCSVISGLKWVESHRQLADVLTKKGVSPYGLLSCIESGLLKY